MKESLLLKKLRMDKRDFVTSAELKGYCRRMKLDYKSAIGHFVSRGHLVRVFRGIFYVKSLDEAKLERAGYSHLDLVAKGLELKGVKNWYFGLYTALKLNNMTHEHFTVDYVINDGLSRPKPINIAGYRFKFVKLAPRLLKFGIADEGLRHSDAEKTVLDFIYVWRYNGVPKEKIVLDLSDWTKGLSREKIRKYAVSYPKTVWEIAEMAVR